LTNSSDSKYSDYKWPDIEAINTFKGNLIHTAHCLAEFKYQGKTVAVIGNGASGV
jgi:cation diffusion facilitator CzcD-associated flavoprotein CzcO